MELRTRQTAGRGCSGGRLVRQSDIYKTCSRMRAGASHLMSEPDNISAPQGPTQLRHNIPALDERLYDLTDEERSFFRQQTGIQDDDELKAHILQVQAEAYKVCNREPLMEIHVIISCLVCPNRFFLILASAGSISQSES